MTITGRIRVGTAGWSIPRASGSRFDSPGSHLQRYANVFSCAEINSSFYRPHAATTYAKWRDSTPPYFKFSVKMPRAITHDLKLVDAREPLTAFFAQLEGLLGKQGPVLIQLPPSFSFDAAVVIPFLDQLRETYDGPVVCEPRHATWFSCEVTSLLNRYRLSTVIADPPPAQTARVVPADGQISYFRLHGSPRMYWSKYDDSYIEKLANLVRGLASEVWCVFDNTGSGAAIENAWALHARLGGDQAQ